MTFMNFKLWLFITEKSKLELELGTEQSQLNIKNQYSASFHVFYPYNFDDGKAKPNKDDNIILDRLHKMSKFFFNKTNWFFSTLQP